MIENGFYFFFFHFLIHTWFLVFNTWSSLQGNYTITMPTGTVLTDYNILLAWNPQYLKIVKNTILHKVITDFLMNDKNTPIIIEFNIIYEVGRCSFVLFTGNQIGFFNITFLFCKSACSCYADIHFGPILKDCE